MYPFCLGRGFKAFKKGEMKEISLDGGVYMLSIDYKAIDVKHKLNSHEYYMNSG